jgi:hypothetical protein
LPRLNLAIFQLCCFRKWAKKISSIIRAASLAAQVICLWELFKSVYLCYAEKQDFFALSEAIQGLSIDELIRMEGKRRGFWTKIKAQRIKHKE